MSRYRLREILRALAQPTTYLGLVLLLSVYCVLAYLLVADLREANDDAEREGANLVRIIEQSYSHVFKSVDASLLYLRKAYLQNPSDFDLSAWVHDPAIDREMTLDFAIVDAKGRIGDTSFSKAVIGADRSDAEPFRVHVDSTEDKLFVSKPVVLKYSKKMAIILSRRITTSDGKFAGVIVALLDPNALTNQVNTVDIGPDGAVGLLGRDGVVRARATQGHTDWKNIGRQLSPKAGILVRMDKAKSGHYWNAPGAFDNVRRLLSYRSLDSLPLIAFVGISEAEVYRHVRDEMRIYEGIALLITAAVLVAIVIGARRERKLMDATSKMQQAQEALQRSQERYALVEGAVDDGVWDRNLVTGEAYYSPRWKNILGYAEHEIPAVAASFLERIHPDDKATFTETFRAHLEENEPYALDLRLRCKNGGYCWVRSRGKALFDASNRPVRMLGTITDISERKQTEALIEDSRNNLARAEAMALLGHTKFEKETGKYTWSAGVYSIMRKSPVSFTPTPENALQLLHPDDRAAHEQYRRDVMAGLDVPRKTLRAVLDDGQTIYVEFWSAPIRAKDGTVIGKFSTIQDVTARKQAEALIDEGRNNLERAERLALLGHYKIESATGKVTWSEGVYRIFDKAPATFTPSLKASPELIHPDDRQTLKQYRRDAMAGLECPPVTLRAVFDDGRIKYVENWLVPIRASDGTVTGVFGTIQDVTARKQAESLIEESRNNLERAERLALLGHYNIDKASKKLTWSEGVYRILGKSPATFTPTLASALEIIHPDDRPDLEQYRRESLAGIDLPPMTLRAVRGDGQLIYVEYWTAPFRASDGTVTGVFGTIQDISARKRAEAQVDESRNNLERAERLALLGHYRIEKGSNKLTWSDGIYRILGKSPATFTPTLDSALEIAHPEDRHILAKHRADAMAGLELPPFQLREVLDDGRIIYVDIWLVPMRAADGSVTGVFGTMQDITARKQAEEALARANQDLETRVAERTAELAQEMRRREEAQMTLTQMQKMEVVGQLTAGIAHDFNNLLAVIRGSLEFVHGSAARGHTADPELIDAAVRATRRGTELVQRLLAFARQSPLKAEPTIIDQLVLDTLRLLQRTLGEGIDIVTRLDAKTATVSVDRNQLATALLNLALNARDAMPEGGQLTIVTKIQPTPSAATDSLNHRPTGEEVCIVISDTGVGMTEDVRSRVFEPFFTTKPDGLGSGLGLSMVYGFVEQSGGRIEIDSVVGRGTTVTIRLPRIVSVGKNDESDAIAGLTARGTEKIVLLVEDDPDVRIVTAAHLKELGYRVHAVTNGMEAIGVIESPMTIDIMLTDMVLPGGIDGFTLVKEALRSRPRMGVLCMSGYDPTKKHRKWLKVQNIEFLEKPFSSGRLAQALDAAVAV